MEWQFRNDSPIYTQLTQRLTQAIVAGEFRPGERLPSVRELAVEAGVNPNTVQRALADLERDGLVFSQRTAPLRDGRCFHDRKREAPSGGSMCGEFSLEMAKARLRQRRGHRPAARPKGGRTMNILECKALTKRYGGKSALEGVDFPIEPGRIVGLLGPNGSGKTTLIKLANGLLTPTSGEILIDGKAPSPETKAIVSLSPRPQRPARLDDRRADRRLLCRLLRRLPPRRAQEMLRPPRPRCFGARQNALQGTREKLQLILVMSRAAKLYLLDEPIGGVDPATRDYILRTIIGNYNEDASVVISTHLIADVEQVLDEVIFLQNGRVERHTTVDAIRGETGKKRRRAFPGGCSNADQTHPARISCHKPHHVAHLRGDARADACHARLPARAAK